MAAVFQATSNGKYIPPSRRAEEMKRLAEEEAKKPINFANNALFPSLGRTVHKSSGWSSVDGQTKTFTETIHNLIAQDKLTAEERAAQEEMARQMEGWAVLKKPKQLTQEWIYKFNMAISTQNAEANTVSKLIELGLYSTASTQQSVKTNRTIRQINVSDSDDLEDVDTALDVESVSDIVDQEDDYSD